MRLYRITFCSGSSLLPYCAVAGTDASMLPINRCTCSWRVRDCVDLFRTQYWSRMQSGIVGPYLMQSGFVGLYLVHSGIVGSCRMQSGIVGPCLMHNVSKSGIVGPCLMHTVSKSVIEGSSLMHAVSKVPHDDCAPLEHVSGLGIGARDQVMQCWGHAVLGPCSVGAVQGQKGHFIQGHRLG